MINPFIIIRVIRLFSYVAFYIVFLWDCRQFAFQTSRNNQAMIPGIHDLSFKLRSIDSSTSPSVWSVFAEIATKTGAYNLGQGFPDWDPPPFMLKALINTASSKYHQYTRPAGHIPLVELIAKRYSIHLNRNIDPMNEIAITVGASQALFLTLTTLLKPGDEIVIFEPFFELYIKQIKLTGATPVFVPLGTDASDPKNPWSLNASLLEEAITPKTKLILLNSPHNPTGKVFTLQELQSIADIVRRNPHVSVISDEVYKYTVYDAIEQGDSSSKGHYHFARLPDMWDRTITLSSCGKTFSCTGWQVGWMVAPKKFILPVHELLPSIQFCVSTPIQHALMLALQEADEPYGDHVSYYEWLRLEFLRKRDLIETSLQNAGMETLPSQGGFFLLGKLPPMDDKVQRASDISGEPYDWEYCRMLANKAGIIAIPASPFFTPRSAGGLYDTVGPMARFAFCKQDATLILAAQKLNEFALTRKRQ